MIDETADVHELPIRPRRDLGEERVLRAVHTGQCWHHHGFTVDDQLAEVTCVGCGEKLNPMWVLGELARRENRYHELHARYHDELKRLADRSRTKCEHCDQMTRISRT
jgi:hypothetical protein